MQYKHYKCVEFVAKTSKVLCGKSIANMATGAPTARYSVGIQVLDGTKKVLVDRVCSVPISTKIGELLQADQPFNIDTDIVVIDNINDTTYESSASANKNGPWSSVAVDDC